MTRGYSCQISAISPDVSGCEIYTVYRAADCLCIVSKTVACSPWWTRKELQAGLKRSLTLNDKILSLKLPYNKYD